MRAIGTTFQGSIIPGKRNVIVNLTYCLQSMPDLVTKEENYQTVPSQQQTMIGQLWLNSPFLIFSVIRRKIAAMLSRRVNKNFLKIKCNTRFLERKKMFLTNNSNTYNVPFSVYKNKITIFLLNSM